jgi:hypothetical protein
MIFMTPKKDFKAGEVKSNEEIIAEMRTEGKIRLISNKEAAEGIVNGIIKGKGKGTEMVFLEHAKEMMNKARAEGARKEEEALAQIKKLKSEKELLTMANDGLILANKNERALKKKQVGELNNKIDNHLHEFKDYEESNEPLSEFQRGEREGLTTAKRRIAQAFPDCAPQEPVCVHCGQELEKREGETLKGTAWKHVLSRSIFCFEDTCDSTGEPKNSEPILK